MNIAAVYLLHRFFYRLTDFFYNWYFRGTRTISHVYIFGLERMDRVFAVKITLRHFFEPLYQDYSVIGRIVGVVFRTVRVLLGLAVYLVYASLFLALWLIWLAIPVILIGYVFYQA